MMGCSTNGAKATMAVGAGILVCICLAVVACAAGVVRAEPLDQSCSTPAMTFATLTTCRTQTARAALGTATPRATPTPPPPTRTPAAGATTAATATPTRIGTVAFPQCEFHFRTGVTHFVNGWCDSSSYWTAQTIPTQWNRLTQIP